MTDPPSITFGYLYDHFLVNTPPFVKSYAITQLNAFWIQHISFEFEPFMKIWFVKIMIYENLT